MDSCPLEDRSRPCLLRRFKTHLKKTKQTTQGGGKEKKSWLYEFKINLEMIL